MRKLKTFAEIKECYKDYDMLKSDENTFCIKNFLIKQNGDVYLSRIGFTNENESVGISTYIFRGLSVAQIEQFIQLVIGE